MQQARPTDDSATAPSGGGRRRHNRPREHRQHNQGSSGQAARGGPSNSRSKPNTDSPDASSNSNPEDSRTNNPQGSSRRQQARQRFGGQLTDANTSTPDEQQQQRPSNRPAGGTRHHHHQRKAASEATDLTSHLIQLLRTPPYPDCPICYSAVHPLQPTWSCSISNAQDGAKASASDCCWTTFHLKCIKAWAAKSVKETKDAYLARGEDHPGEWRCPNCQSKRTVVPAAYVCFCQSTADPKPPRFAVPHSCALPCTRSRRTCNHPCPLQCHPGPCPPCVVTLSLSCYCGKEIKSLRCSNRDSEKEREGRECGQVCDKPLGCGNPDHKCQNRCHQGTCEPCKVVLDVSCWCGRTSKEIKCGEQTDYSCNAVCDVPYDCGVHRCEEKCHPHAAGLENKSLECPLSPKVVTSCPCGRTRIAPGARKTCSDPILTCQERCDKPFTSCEHLCPEKCHVGPCAPCAVPISRHCRCGAAAELVPCHLFANSSPLLCNTPCPSLRSCGRHQCTTRCCPAASVKKSKGKRKVVAANSWQDEIEKMEKEQLEKEWHLCEIVCGKTLGCGKHACEERDHKGPCPPCLRSSFEELICPCGKTVLFPPIPCGTKISCPFPCARPPPVCGHSKVPHNCHSDDLECPPCPYLVRQLCMCGKKEVENVRCSLAQTGRVGCGTKCGKTMDCGFHTCEKLCHSDACGSCTAVCGKDRKYCLPNHHPCLAQCHAPSACDESQPCRATISLTCSCGRLQKPAPCLNTSTNENPPSSRELKCTSECAIAARNARLAEALGISAEVRERAEKGIVRDVDWSGELRAFGKANARFVDIVEKAFADFIRGEKKTIVLPSMPEAKRNFVHSMGEVYRISTQSVDAEPHRSVQLTKRLDTRVPHPLLSSVINAPLGKLGDLKHGVPSRSNPTSAKLSLAPSSSVSPSSPGAKSFGWSGVVAVSSETTTPSRSALSSGSTSNPTSMTPWSRPPPSVTTATPESVPEDWEADS